MEGHPVLDDVRTIIARVAGHDRTPADPGPATPLGEHGYGLDSAALLEVILSCEEAFDVTLDSVSDLAVAGRLTLGDLAEAIRRARR
jgi:acyl carrier protein